MSWRSYDETAPVYERIWAPRFAECASDLVGLASPQAGERVLDIATGTGIAADVAAGAVGAEGLVAGIDRSLPMMEAGAGAGRRALRALAEAGDLPFRDAAFDLVTCNFALHLFPRPQAVLGDAARVLGPGGRLATATWADGDDEDDLTRTWNELVDAAIGSGMRDTVRGDAAPGRQDFGVKGNLDEAFRRAGFRNLRIDKREYRFRFSIDEYLEGLSVTAVGRFTRDMLGDEGFAAFVDRAKAAFADRFADPLNDFNEVLLTVGSKP